MSYHVLLCYIVSFNMYMHMKYNKNIKEKKNKNSKEVKILFFENVRTWFFLSQKTVQTIECKYWITKAFCNFVSICFIKWLSMTSHFKNISHLRISPIAFNKENTDMFSFRFFLNFKTIYCLFELIDSIYEI